ncbi:MAG: FUSC family protein [Verrucomicrobiaceae bacterium]|nr:MAG: FUSC family protein [Verrucomicrobiaceae bacterium]
MIRKHLTPLFEWKSPGLGWHVPFLAALGVGIPVFLGFWFHQPRQAMLAATGAMVILYLPPVMHSVRAALVRLLGCAAGFGLCYVSAAACAFHSAAAVSALCLLTLLATACSRWLRIPPPGSFFPVVIASIACNARFDPVAIPINTVWLLFGSLVSCILAFIYMKCRSGPRASAECPQPTSIKNPATQSSNDSAVNDSVQDQEHRSSNDPVKNLPVPNLPAILIESSIIATFVALSLLIARLLNMENPYWVPISCAAILQGGTFRAVWHRNVHRIVGTALGMGLSWFLFPSVPHPVAVIIIMVSLVFVVEYLVSRHYGLAVIFITPMTVCFAEFTSGGVPIHGLFTTRLLDIILGSLIGAAGGIILHHPEWCRKMEAWLRRRFFTGQIPPA